MSEITEASVLIAGGTRRPRGRPKAEEPGVPVMAWVPASTADRLCKLALKYDVSVSAVVCQILTRRSKKI